MRLETNRIWIVSEVFKEIDKGFFILISLV